MLRIIEWRLPRNETVALAETRKSSVERLQKLVHMHSDNGDEFVIEPMATTSDLYFQVEQILRSLFGDPPHLAKDLTADYALLRTRAPVAYDYDYVIQIGTVAGEFGEERLVAMPKKSVEYQSGRYSSGMFTPINCS